MRYCDKCLQKQQLIKGFAWLRCNSLAIYAKCVVFAVRFFIEVKFRFQKKKKERGKKKSCQELSEFFKIQKRKLKKKLFVVSITFNFQITK